MASEAPVVSVVAPPGYGKTTLLMQWAEHLGPRVAWVSCERSENDPVALWTEIIAALDRLEPVSEPATSVLSAFGGSVDAVPRLVAALSTMRAPVTVVLDHLEAVTRPEATTAIAELALRLPPGWRLALASRVAMPIPLSLLRIDRRVIELGARDLAMDHEEAKALLRQAGADLVDAAVDDVVLRTEGWPAGLYLAALAITSGAPTTDVLITGDDRLVEDYLRSELLARVPEAQVSFLLHTSMLDRLTGPLCDAVVDDVGSARVLEQLARNNLLVVPLDRRGEWYRYHHLLREMLRSELRRGDPALLARLHARAAPWHEGNGMFEAAIHHADAAGDVDRLSQLVLDHMQPTWVSGRVDTVRAWMELVDRRRGVPNHAAIAAHGALIFALLGRARETERWVGVAESLPATGTLPDGSTEAATLAYMRAILGRRGPAVMREDASLAYAGLSPASPYRATMLHTQGAAWLLEGDLDRADQLFTHAYDVAEAFDVAPLAALVLAEQAFVATERRDPASADSLLQKGVKIVDAANVDAYWTSALVLSAAAHAAARRGNMPEARAYVRRAAQLRPLLTHALPVVSVQALLELARAYLALVDPAGALAVLEQADGILRRRPDLGSLPNAVARVRARVDQITVARAVGHSSLTTAEMRLLPLLPTHLSLPQIAERLFVSPHTVRSQVKSIYRKLGVSSRGEVVEMTATGPPS
jgi:LuxR family maltose regulon positive regulatory protein